MDVQISVVIDEAQSAKLVHKKADARPRGWRMWRRSPAEGRCAFAAWRANAQIFCLPKDGQQGWYTHPQAPYGPHCHTRPQEPGL
jgi:hypothetical protein